MKDLMGTVGELIEVIHKELASLRVDVNDLKSHDNISTKIRLHHIDERMEKIEAMYFTHAEKDFEELL